jgi:predicted phosphodiesterase
MNHRDIGRLEGEVLLFGGPYSNLQATQAVAQVAAARGIAPGNMICTGDVVAYCADPLASLALVRELGCVVVAGNCERQLAAGAADCGCGFQAGTACDLLSAGWFAHADARVGAADRAWMADCPDIVTFQHEGARCAVIHGGLSDISRFLWPVSPKAEFAEEIACIERAVGPVDRVIAGHCGLGFARQIGAVSWVNAGVIGMPPHDGRQATRYAVMSGGQVILHRLDYDAPAAADAMRLTGLVQGYEQSLLSGIWPSEDVLPQALRRDGAGPEF